SVPTLTRAWQMLLKGLMEVRDAARPLPALEMALIRVAYAAELPPTDKLVRDLIENGAAPRASSPPPPAGGGNRAPSARLGEGGATAPRLSPQLQTEGAPTLSRLEDIVALAVANNAPILRVQIENNMHLV